MKELLKEFASQERKYASWRINCLFFFLSASHVTLWPWVPLILFYTGCTLNEIGMIVSLLQLISILSVKLTLSSVTRTKSGSTRRCLLLCSATLSFLFGFTALLLTPPIPNSESFCSPVETMKFGDDLGNNLTTSLSHDLNKYQKIDVQRNEHSAIRNNSIKDAVKQSNNSGLTYPNISSDINLSSFDKGTINGSNHTPGQNGMSIKATTEDELYPKKKQKNRLHNKTVPESKSNRYTKNDYNMISDNINNEKTKANRHADAIYDYDRSYSNYDTEYSPNEQKLEQSLIEIDPVYSIANEYRPLRGRRLGGIYLHSKKMPLTGNLYNRNDGITESNYDEGYHLKKLASINADQAKVRKSFRTISKRSVETKHNITSKPKTEIPNGLPGSSTLLAIGIFATIIFSMTFGGGTEIAVTKLWDCCIYGVPHDNGILNGIESNLVPSIKSPYRGNHKIWSLIASSIWLFVTIIAICLVCKMGFLVSPFKILCVFFFTSEILKCISLLIIHVPHGELCNEAPNRTLGLYLDNEVIEEGIRRIAFHTWILFSAFIISLPSLYTILILQEAHSPQKDIWVSQTGAIAALLIGEAIILSINGWVTTKFNIPGLMIATGVLVAAQNIFLYNAISIWMKSLSTLLIGAAIGCLWTSIRINSQVLGTPDDQQRESWISWACFKVGMGIGSIMWTTLADTRWFSRTLSNALPISAFFATMTSCMVVITILFCRKRKKSRRIYHTLDVGGASDDETDDSEINLNEDDWLVKRAKKEGFKL